MSKQINSRKTALAVLIFITGIVKVDWTLAQKPYSTITSFYYNKRKDQSEYSVLPFGQISLPGKWKKEQFDKVSKQQRFIKSDDSLWLSVLFARCDRFEFNHDASQTGFAFVKAYYDWEKNFFTQTGELKAEIIEQDSARAYLIWHLYGVAKKQEVDCYFLYRDNNCRVSNFYLEYAQKLNASARISFLKSLMGEE